MATVTRWQESAITDFTAHDAEAAFFAVIESVPAGRRFSVNDLRHRLDAVEVPDRRRGNLFHAAVSAGLIQPVTVNTWGIDHPLRIPSTGASANGATVRVYRRLGDELPHKPAGASAPASGTATPEVHAVPPAPGVVGGPVEDAVPLSAPLPPQDRPGGGDPS